MKIPRFISIKLQFVLIAMLLVAASSALWGWWTWHNERDLLYSSMEREGEQMVTSLASPIINALLYEEMGVIEEGGLLDNFIEEIVNNPGLIITYAFVADHTGKVLAHNRYDEYGKVYTDRLTVEALSRTAHLSRLTALAKGETPVFEIAMPLRIHGKRWGVLQVGISTEPLQEELRRLTRRIVSTSSAFFLLGVLASYLIGRSMSRPLERLSAVMSSVSTQNLTVPMPPSRPDEIGQLQESFTAMLQRLRQSEAERETAVAQLVQSEKLASLGKLVAGVAHEVNNPLGAINTCIFNIEQQSGSQARSLELIKLGVQRIERIVRQLNDFCRTASLELLPIESDRFFSESVEFGSLALKRHQIRLIAEDRCQPTLELLLDRGKIQQVLLNLLNNAADASSPEGEIRLTALTADGWYRLEVADQGEGIPEPIQQTIFDLFYTTKPAGEGTGVGLAICKSIVELHGGTISVVSRPGDTRFTVSLPLQRMENKNAQLQTVAG